MAVAGKIAYVQVGAALYAFSSWEAEITGDQPDVTTFSSQGFRENVDGVAEANLTLRGPYAPGSMPLTKGVVYNFTLGISPTVSYVVPARVKSIRPNVDVKGAAQVQVMAESTGVFTPSIL